MSEFRIIAFDKQLNKENFDCDIDELNNYLKKYASQDIKRRVAQTFVICSQNSEIIIGFYNLAASSIKLDSLPVNIAKKLPKYPNEIALSNEPAFGVRGLGLSSIDINIKAGSLRSVCSDTGFSFRQISS